MPVTSFALLIFGVLLAAAATVWAFTAWGAATMLPVLMVLALVARWAMSHVPHDEQNP